MSIEAGILKKEEEKKKKVFSEKEKTLVDKKKIDIAKNKEEVNIRENSEIELFELKDLLENGNLDANTKKLVEKIVSSNIIGEEEIKEIFEKIDEIENNNNISKYLPKEFRITKEEYKKALTDDTVRIQILTKLDAAITIIIDHINPNSTIGINLFSGFMIALDKNLITIQENHIDIKKSLEKIEKIKNPKKDKTLLEEIKDFITSFKK